MAGDSVFCIYKKKELKMPVFGVDYMLKYKDNKPVLTVQITLQNAHITHIGIDNW